jgi:lipopolysaccharide/colanic/teichoic acid biosynthesis glycosyltransferase
VSFEPANPLLGQLARTIDIALPSGALAGKAQSRRRRFDRGRRPDGFDFGGAPPRMAKRDALYRRSLAAGDILAAAFAFIVGPLVFEGTLPQPLLLAGLPLVVVAGKISGLYDHDEYRLRRTTLDEVPALFQAATAYSLLVLVGGELLVTFSLDHGVLVALWGLLFLSLTMTRVAVRWYLAHGGRTERCLVLGDASAASRLSRSFEVTGSVRAEVVGRLPLEQRGSDPDSSAALAPIEEVLNQERIDRVVIASRRGDSELMVSVVRLVKNLGVKVSVLPGLFEAVGSSASVDEVDGLLLLGLREEQLTKTARLLKRTVDLALGGALLVLTAPVMAATALGAARTPGPVLLREEFLDRHGRPFEMLSFRTKWRRFGVHALPRLVSLLRGQLSLVGPHPRPVVSGRVPLNGQALADLAPGLTGLWRLRGSAQSPEELPTLDYLYTANWSLWLDAKIMLRTAVALARGRRGLEPRAVGARPRRWSGGRSLMPSRRFHRNGNGNGNVAGENGWDGVEAAAPSHTNGNGNGNGHANGHANGAKHTNGNGNGNGHANAAKHTNGNGSAKANGSARPNGAALAVGGAAVATAPVALDRTPARRHLPVRPVRLSAVVPATNQPRTLDQCLEALRGARDGPDEIVVVEDPDLRGGPAAARNEGASRASGDVLVFVDADVVVHSDAFSRIRALFERDPGLTGVFGSYDDGLLTNGRVAIFRNVLHHHVHHSKPGVADTFWSGLGAVRRQDFLDCGGFDPERFPYPSVEDIDLGMRLTARGARIVLNPRIQGTHLKDWHLREMLYTDFSRRAVPWVGLLTERRGAPRSTLNLGWRHRASAGFAVLGVGALLARRPKVAAGAAVSLFGLNSSFYVLLARRYGLRTTVAAMLLHLVHHLISVAGVPVGILARLNEKRGGRSLGHR